MSMFRKNSRRMQADTQVLEPQLATRPKRVSWQLEKRPSPRTSSTSSATVSSSSHDAGSSVSSRTSTNSSTIPLRKGAPSTTSTCSLPPTDPFSNPTSTSTQEMHYLSILLFPQFLHALNPLRRSPNIIPTAPSSDLNLFYPPLFTTLAICDPKILGHPIRHSTPSFRLPPRGMRVGKCAFLNIPVWAPGRLHVSPERESSGEGALRFVLEHTAHLIDDDGDVTYVLAARMDVTRTIRVLASAGLGSAVSTTVDASRESAKEEDDVGIDTDAIDWIGAACQTNRKVHLNAGSPEIPQPLLHEFAEQLADIRLFHRDVFVLSPFPSLNEKEPKKSWRIRYTSPSLVTSEMEGLLARVVKVLSPVLNVAGRERARISCVLPWANVGSGRGQQKRDRDDKEVRRRVYCVPVVVGLGGTIDGGGGWVCFVVSAGIPDLWAL